MIQIAIIFFSLYFSIPFSWRVSYIIQLTLGHLDPTLVDYLSPYLSARPIKHPFQPFVSCGSQGNTVQRSSPYKCSQKSSCNAFNAVVVAFPQIFLSFLLSRMFMRHIPIFRAFWRVTLISRVHTWATFVVSEEGFLLFHSFPTYETLTWNPLTTIYSFSNLSMSQIKPKAQYMILGTYPYNSPSKFRFFPFIRGGKVGF